MLFLFWIFFLLGSVSNDVRRQGLYADFVAYINSEVTYNNLVHGGYWVSFILAGTWVIW